MPANSSPTSSQARWIAHSALTRSPRDDRHGAAHEQRVVEHQELRVEQPREVRAAAGGQSRADGGELLARALARALEPPQLAVHVCRRHRRT